MIKLAQRAPAGTLTQARCDALYWIAGGETAANVGRRAADPREWDRFRTPEGLAGIAAVLTRGLIPGDELAAEYQCRAAVRAVEMAALEAEGWTQAKAMAALDAHNGQARKVLAAVNA